MNYIQLISSVPLMINLQQYMPSMLGFANVVDIFFKDGCKLSFFVFWYPAYHALNYIVSKLMFC